ncbi:MAG: hypothetical protein ACRDH9_04585 [Actinomycetota bacterium]
MPNHEHTHEGSDPHDHDEATAGHDHDTSAPSAPATTTAAMDVGPSAGGLSLRIVLTLIGAAGMIAGAFLAWFNFGDAPAGVDLPGNKGIEMSWKILYAPENGSPTYPFDNDFFTSIGFVAIVLGLLAVLGLALRTGWLSRLAGALAIVAVVLYAITLYRVPGADLSISDFGIGVWVAAASGLIVLIGGFLGSRRIVSAKVPAA